MYRWVEHTAEVQLELSASSESGLFEEAVPALAELLAHDVRGETVVKTVTAEAADGAGLMVEWINSLVVLAETEGLIPVRARGVQLGDSGGTSISAEVETRRGTARDLVKAATYHRLQLAPDGAGWHARVVLDV